MLVLIRGGGDIATGIALRLYRAGCSLVLTALPAPTAIRRTVCFSEAVRLGETTVENITARLAHSPEEALALTRQGMVAILADETGVCLPTLRPQAIVDARLAKRNIDTRMDQAPVVIGVGPGFTAGVDCHAVVETQRGHFLGRAIYEGPAAPNTGIPGNIGGYTTQRVLRAPADGILTRTLPIGSMVEAGQAAGYVGGLPMVCEISGVLRGILPENTPVTQGMKSGDVDPRGALAHCSTASDKALAVAGGVLEALLGLSGTWKGAQA